MLRTYLINALLQASILTTYMIISMIMFFKEKKKILFFKLFLFRQNRDWLTEWTVGMLILLSLDTILSVALLFTVNPEGTRLANLIYNSLKLLTHIINVWGTFLLFGGVSPPSSTS